jgi:gas vesicle protein
MPSSWSDMLYSGISYAIIGAGVGGVIGAAKTYFPSDKVSEENKQKLSKYPNILLDYVAIGIVNKLQIYEKQIQKEYDIILSNLDKLIGLQVEINKGQIKVYFPYRATTYVTEIQTALQSARGKLRNISVPHWEEDEKTIQSIAEDYLYNINQDVDSFLLTQRSR